MKKSDDDSGGRLWDRDEIERILEELRRAETFGATLYRLRTFERKVSIHRTLHLLAVFGYDMLARELDAVENSERLPADMERFLPAIHAALGLSDAQKRELDGALRLDVLRDAFSELVAEGVVSADEALGLLYKEVQVLRQAGLLN
jgi:hypothetical protein